jgi:hypothetical protein
LRICERFKAAEGVRQACSCALSGPLRLGSSLADFVAQPASCNLDCLDNTHRLFPPGPVRIGKDLSASNGELHEIHCSLVNFAGKLLFEGRIRSALSSLHLQTRHFVSRGCRTRTKTRVTPGQRSAGTRHSHVHHTTALRFETRHWTALCLTLSHFAQAEQASIACHAVLPRFHIAEALAVSGAKQVGHIDDTFR